MKWIEDKTFENDEYKAERKRLEQIGEGLIKKYSSTIDDPNEIRRLITTYLTGSIDKKNIEGLSNLLARNGMPPKGVTMYYDPSYDDFIKDLVSLHDQFLETSILCYDFATPEELERDRQREIQMYGSLITGLMTNSKNVGTTDKPFKQAFPVNPKRDELIPHDPLFEYGKKTLRLLSSDSGEIYPKHLYEDLLKELKNRLETLVKMSNETYAEEKIELLNQSKIKHNNAKTM